MKIKNLFALSSFLLASTAFAQAPSIEFPFEEIGQFLITRLHTLNLDTQTGSMQPGSKKNYVAGFTAEGALSYQYEYAGDNLSDWNDIGRNAGGQWLPYSVQVLKDGSRKISVSAYGFRNMLAMSHSTHTDDLEWHVFDRLDLFTLTWDQGMSFNNIRTFDIDLLTTNLKFNIAKNADGTNYLALRTGIKGGTRNTTITNIGDYGYSKDKASPFGGDRDPAFGAQYMGGLELNLQAKKKNGVRLNVQSNYLGGIDRINLVNEKTAAQQGLRRTYGHLKNTTDVSIPMALKNGHPMRLGVAVDANVVFFDKAVNKDKQTDGAAKTIDFKDHYNQKFRGRLYLNF